MQYALAILSIVPALIKVIAAIEEAFPQSGAGKEKLSAVREIITASYEGITGLWPSLEKIVGVVVNMANAIGAFKKSEG